MNAQQDSTPTLLRWFPQFLRHELAPYPGRYSLVARMVLSATLSMIVIVTFRIPYGAIGVNCAFILSRENLTATAKSGFYFILAFVAWAALTPIGARLFASVPLTHFLWEGVNAFLCFYLLKTLTNFPLATGIVVVSTATMAIWYLPGPAEQNIELTLWQILATAIGALITFLVEVVFRYYHPHNLLQDGIDDRLRAVEDLLNEYGRGTRIAEVTSRDLTQYAFAGDSRLREQIQRAPLASLERTKTGALLSLVSRCIDLSAGLASAVPELNAAEQRHAAYLAQRIVNLRNGIRSGNLSPDPTEKSAQLSAGSLFSELEITIHLMLSVLRSKDTASAKPQTLDASDPETRLFVKDVFTNPEYLRYALVGTAAAMLCYVIYVGLNWPGISTAVTTCILTALSTTGSSRQKQTLRVVGATIGGFLFGIGSQIFVLPYIDSIVGLSLLLAAVTAVSAYVATSSTRLSYVGLQMAFAFYLINVTDFTISRDLTIGRDRAVGILLGIGAMWLVFGRLYSRSAATEMMRGFAKIVRLLATLLQTEKAEDDGRNTDEVEALRSQISGLFSIVNAEADAVSFETGSERTSHIAARDWVLRWLPALHTVYVLELSLASSMQGDPDSAAANTYSRKALSNSLNKIAECLEDQLNGIACCFLMPDDASTRPFELDSAPSPQALLARIIGKLEQDALMMPIRLQHGAAMATATDFQES